jgi:hypothetical protein
MRSGQFDEWPQSLLVITGFEKRVEFFLFVDLRFFFCVPGPVVFADQATNALSF